MCYYGLQENGQQSRKRSKMKLKIEIEVGDQLGDSFSMAILNEVGEDRILRRNTESDLLPVFQDMCKTVMKHGSIYLQFDTDTKEVTLIKR